MISLSPTVRPLLDVLQLRCGISIEVVDASLRPIEPELRRESGGTLDAGMRERCFSVLRSGEARIDRSVVPPIALCPLWQDREVVGLVLIVRKGSATATFAAADDFRHLEAAGQLVRAVLEHDLVTSARLERGNERMRRLQGTLRFIAQLAAREGETEMMHAVVQAASVWFDLDCRIYNREPDGSWALFSALPGLDTSKLDVRLEQSRVRDLVAQHRLSSAPELELPGTSVRRGEILVFPIGEGPDWVVLLTGVLDPDVESTFAALVHVITGELQQAASRRIERWQTRLMPYVQNTGLAPERVLLHLLEELVTTADARGGRVSLEQAGEERTLGAINAPDPSLRSPSADVEVQRHARRVQVGPDSFAQLELWAHRDLLGWLARAQVDAWLAVITPWLCGALATLIAHGSIEDRIEQVTGLEFERRIQEEVDRAKRFNLELSLVVVDWSPARAAAGGAANIVQAMRPELRASDLIGRIRGGMLAVLLVHTGHNGAASVTTRLRQKLGEFVNEARLPNLRVGRAIFSQDCPTADALVRQAVDERQALASRVQ